MTENDQKGKITLGLITSWGLGSLFLLAGIACIADPDASGAVVPMLLVALLLLPPVRGFVHQKTGKSLSMSLRVVCVLILMGFAAAAMPKTNSLESSVATINNAATTLSATSASSPAPEASQPSSPAVAATQPQGQKGLVVESFTLQTDSYGIGKVVGTAKNNTKKQYAYVQVEFNLYDDTGAQVGSTIANINNFEAGGTWNFEAPVLETRATQAKLKGITSF